MLIALSWIFFRQPTVTRRAPKSRTPRSRSMACLTAPALNSAADRVRVIGFYFDLITIPFSTLHEEIGWGPRLHSQDANTPTHRARPT